MLQGYSSRHTVPRKERLRVVREGDAFIVKGNHAQVYETDKYSLFAKCKFTYSRNFGNVHQFAHVINTATRISSILASLVSRSVDEEEFKKKNPK